MPIRQVIQGRKPIKVYTNDLDEMARAQLKNLTELPFIHSHVAAMPDCHGGMGSTIGSVIPTKGAIIPAAVGVDLGLVLTGMLAQRGDRLKQLAASLEIADRVHFLGHVPRSTLVALYRRAVLMAFPSRFEGFGLPLVEAMQLDCPIVASKAGAVVEVAAGAAEHCDDNPTAWADAIAGVCGDSSQRDRLIRRGRARAAQFDWERCAQRQLETLRSLAKT